MASSHDLTPFIEHGRSRTRDGTIPPDRLALIVERFPHVLHDAAHLVADDEAFVRIMRDVVTLDHADPRAHGPRRGPTTEQALDTYQRIRATLDPPPPDPWIPPLRLSVRARSRF